MQLITRQGRRALALAFVVVGVALPLAALAPASAAIPAAARVPAAAQITPALFAKLATGVVLIRGFDCSGTGRIEGTGFLVGSGVVMTARHVVDPAGAEAKLACRVKVQIDGHWIAAAHTTWWYRGSDPTGRGTDLATVKLAHPASASDYIFDFRNSSAPPGTNLAMIGHPLGTEISLTQGRLLARIRNHGVPLMAIRMLGAAGSSGSPIVDDGGHVVGVLQLGLGSGETSGVSLGIDLPSWWGSGHAVAKTLCTAYPLGGVPGCPGTKPTPPPPPAYAFSGCWLQPLGDNTAHQETATTTVAGADVLAAGAANWRLYYQLSVAAPTALPISLTFSEPNGAVFETDPGTWDSGISYLFTDLAWTFPDGTLFFQSPAVTGSGIWTAKMTLPNGSNCSVAFTVS
jgi:hypothetical protein